MRWYVLALQRFGRQKDRGNVQLDLQSVIQKLLLIVFQSRLESANCSRYLGEKDCDDFREFIVVRIRSWCAHTQRKTETHNFFSRLIVQVCDEIQQHVQQLSDVP